MPSLTGLARLAVDLVWAVLLVAAGFTVVLLLSHTPIYLANATNSDGLLAVSLIRDLSSNDYAAAGFQLPRVPSIVPDLALQALAGALSPSDRWAVFLYSVFQFELLVAAMAWVVRLLTGVGYLFCATAALLIVSAIAWVDMDLATTTGMVVGWMEPCIHFGPYLLCLVAFGLASRLLQRWGWISAALLFVLSTLAMLSDKLTLAGFLVPALLAVAVTAWLAWRRIPGRALGVGGLLLGATALALVLDRGLNRQPDIGIKVGAAPGRLYRFVVETLGFVGTHQTSVLTGVALPVALSLVFLHLRTRRGRAAEAFGPKPHTGLRSAPEGGLIRMGERQIAVSVLFLVLAGVLAVGAVTGATALLLYEDFGSYRYLVPVLVWPIILAAGTLCLNASVRIGVTVVAAGAMLGLAGAVAQSADRAPGIVSMTTPAADCLMAQHGPLGLKAGLAGYWIARQTTFLTNRAIQIDQASKEGQPQIWGNDPYTFLKSINGSGPTVYNFFVMTGLDPAAVTGFYGAPSRTFQCPAGGPVLWIYDDAPTMTAKAVSKFQPPSGSYRSTCTDAMNADGDILARCTASSGPPRYNRLRRGSACRGDVQNHDGALACVRRP